MHNENTEREYNFVSALNTLGYNANECSRSSTHQSHSTGSTAVITQTTSHCTRHGNCNWRGRQQAELERVCTSGSTFLSRGKHSHTFPFKKIGQKSRVVVQPLNPNGYFMYHPVYHLKVLQCAQRVYLNSLYVSQQQKRLFPH